MILIEATAATKKQLEPFLMGAKQLRDGSFIAIAFFPSEEKAKKHLMQCTPRQELQREIELYARLTINGITAAIKREP